jgi:preprotein translocase subunit SecB
MKKDPKEIAKGKPKLHPIQLIHLGVKELFIKSNRSPEIDVGLEPEKCVIHASAMPYDAENKRIMVSMRLESGINIDKTKTPYGMRIELVGVFAVDEANFDIKHIDSWAENGAPYIMFPYLREHAYSLSSRCGFKPLLLPLLELPTFQIQKPKTSKPKNTEASKKSS